MAEMVEVELEVGSVVLACHAVEGVEALNALYELVIDASAEVEPHEVAETVGESARLVFRMPERHRALHGVVLAATCEGEVHIEGHHRFHYRIELGPRLHLTTLRQTSRVFETSSAASIIAEVLEPYGIPVEFRLLDELPVRPYTTQLGETDWDLIKRLAADHGLSFFFEQPAAMPGELGAVPEIAAELLEKGGELIGGETGELLERVSAVATPRALLVFVDRAPSYPLCVAPRPWEALLSTAISALRGLGGRAGAMIGQAAAVVDRVVDAAAWEQATFDVQSESGGLHHPHERVIQHLATRREEALHRTVFRHYDPWRPASPLEAHAEVESSAIGGLVAGAREGRVDAEGVVEALVDVAKAARRLPSGGAEHGEHGDEHREEEHEEEQDPPLATYLHHGRSPTPDWRYERDEAKRMLRSARRRRLVARGRSSCPWLTPGHVVIVRDHPREALNGRWLVIRVEHRVRPPTDAEGERYLAEFEAVPADTFYPPAPSPRRFVQTIETAEVVGEGHVSTNERGQIRVLFHWERRERATCWLRVMQPWAGAGFGAQFLPRVGTEVVVAFEGGDPDMPIVLGGVYNGVQPPPFRLPEEQRRSGFRSRSIPATDGAHYNELSFDDTAGEELVRLRAEHDFEQRVLHDRAAEIGHDDRLHVRHDRHVDVEGDSHERYRGDREVEVVGTHRTAVEGSRSDAVQGDARQTVRGAVHREVHGSDVDVVRGSRSISTEGEVVVRTAGSHALVVGGPDGDRTAAVTVQGDHVTTATGDVIVQATGLLTLRCGNSQIVMGPDRIVIQSPEVVVQGEDARISAKSGKLKLKASSLLQGMADQIVLAGSSSTMAMSSEVSVDGSRILLNSPGQASDPVEADAIEPTIIELTDQQGQAIPHQPFRIVFADGSERAGALDADGRAEIELERGGDIIFPGLVGVEAG